MKGLKVVGDAEATRTGEENGRKDGGGNGINFLWKHPLFPMSSHKPLIQHLIHREGGQYYNIAALRGPWGPFRYSKEKCVVMF